MDEEREYPDSTVEAKEKAEESGKFEVIVADDNMLLLDIDSASDMSLWIRACYQLDQYAVRFSHYEEWSSKSGNTHVRIALLNPMPVLQRIGVEVILGSDRKRAALAWRGIHAEEPASFPCMLFRPKEAEVKTVKAAA